MELARLTLVWVVVALSPCALSGCAGSGSPSILRGGAALRISAIQPVPEVDVPVCGEEELVVTNDGVAIDLECDDGHRRCSSELPIAIRNCTAGPVLVSSLVLRGGWNGGAMIVEFDPLPAVRPGEAWFHPVSMSSSRELEVEVELVALDGEVRPVPMRASVRNPNREEAMARCRECNGDWGRHGLLGLEGCLCRTRDAGRECRDGRECEGTCLYERSEKVQEASESCSDGYCNVTLEMLVLVGRCSEFVTTFGCHHYLPDGISEKGPFMTSYPAPYRCCD
jgi:hypothetical protein